MLLASRAKNFWAALLLPLAFVLAGCKSPGVEITVLNHTGGTVNLLEVDYPSASFGVNSLPAGAVYHYRVRLQDSGPVQAQFTEGRTRQYKSTGPTVHEKQEGRIEIVLDPDGKIKFYPQLDPPQ